MKAEMVLEEAMKRDKTSHLDDLHVRQLKTQLALSILLQGKGHEAEHLIFDLTKCCGTNETTTCQLLYCLALSYVHDLESKAAR